MSNIGFCGKNCELCVAFRATKKNDLRQLAQLAIDFEIQYDMHALPHKYRCVGCIKNGAKSIACIECKIRNCALESKLPSCNFCPDFPCELHYIFSEDYTEYKHNIAQIKSR